MTLGEGAGLLTMCRLRDGLWGKLDIGDTDGGTEASTAGDTEGGGGGGSGGGGGGGGGVVFFLIGDDDAAKDIALFSGRLLTLPPPPPESFGVEKSSSISAASCELVPLPPAEGDGTTGGMGVRVMLAGVVILDSTYI